MITNIYLERVRNRYWCARSYFSLARQLLRYPNRGFAAHLAEDYLNYLLNRVTPVKGETQTRVQAAVDWLLRAQDSSPDDGVSFGFFPCHTSGTFNGWRPSYPETTGYVIPSLLHFS